MEKAFSSIIAHLFDLSKRNIAIDPVEVDYKTLYSYVDKGLLSTKIFTMELYIHDFKQPRRSDGVKYPLVACKYLLRFTGRFRFNAKEYV